MSVVTGITIQIGDYEDAAIVEKQIAAWIATHPDREFGNLCEINLHMNINMGGYKHPQIRLFNAGFNYFPNEEFIAFFKTFTNSWSEPETVILIVNHEEGAAVVVRGTDA